MDNYLVKCLADAAASLDGAAEHANEIQEYEMCRLILAARNDVEAVLKAEVNSVKLVSQE